MQLNASGRIRTSDLRYRKPLLCHRATDAYRAAIGTAPVHGVVCAPYRTSPAGSGQTYTLARYVVKLHEIYKRYRLFPIVFSQLPAELTPRHGRRSCTLGIIVNSGKNRSSLSVTMGTGIGPGRDRTDPQRPHRGLIYAASPDGPWWWVAYSCPACKDSGN